MSLFELFVDVVGFCNLFLPQGEQRLLSEGSKRLRLEFPKIVCYERFVAVITPVLDP